MTMKYEDKIWDFLAQKENLPIAIEIADSIEKVKRRVGNGFWERVRPSLQRRLEEGGLHGGWCQELKKDEEGFAFGILLYPKPERDPVALFRYGLEEELEKPARYHIYQGIFPPSPVPRALNKPVSDLQSPLLDEGYEKSKGWTVWKYIRDFTSENEFVLTVADRGDEFASGVAENFWDFFDATRARVEKLNAALPACRKKAPK